MEKDDLDLSSFREGALYLVKHYRLHYNAVRDCLRIQQSVRSQANMQRSVVFLVQIVKRKKPTRWSHDCS